MIIMIITIVIIIISYTVVNILLRKLIENVNEWRYGQTETVASLWGERRWQSPIPSMGLKYTL